MTAVDPTTEQFRGLAERVIDALLEADPVSATALGDHRFDDRLPELGHSATADLLLRLDDHLTELDAIDDVELGLADLVDLEILRAKVQRVQFDLGEVRRQDWDPMTWNPGTALHLLLSRPYAPDDVRAEAVRGRLAAIPDSLADARATLDEMSAIHVETAMAQLLGTRALIDGDARALAGDDGLADAAAAAVDDFRGWLGERLSQSHRDPRLGSRLYAGALWHTLDAPIAPDDLISDAREHLAALSTALVEAAGAFLGWEAEDDDNLVRHAFARLAEECPVTDETVLPLMDAALARTAHFARVRDLVTVPDVEIRLIDMPMIHRGVAVAYCDAPGPLEAADVPTFVAVAPTPAGWEQERVASFYREYNGIQLHDLAMHEGIPGHVLQLAHAKQLPSPTRVRRFGRSGVFVEGWAVYAEEMMVQAGYAPDDRERADLAMRLQQLKMQARATINAILDVGVHAQGMDESEAMWLMCEVGFQEEGEAVGKWRRALLTATQLPTYFVGYRAVSQIVEDLQVLHAEWPIRDIHDLMLAQGSPAPRHLRTLLGI
jgi:hypothetical protein